jgi:predicted AAA+ superfamily ATPase
MEYLRQQYLQKLIEKMHNGRIKIITGIRRCGKSYLLFRLFRQHLQNHEVSDSQIICLALDEIANAKYRHPSHHLFAL